MKIFVETKELVQKEKHYTSRILNNLMIIERDKLYCDLKYSSLHKYIVKELKYSDTEATIRVNAVRLMLKSKLAKQKIESGDLTLTNASEANKAIKSIKNISVIDNVIEKASRGSTREFKKYVDKELKKERKEILVLPEYLIEKFDKLRKKYGDVSTLELIQILLEKELKAPVAEQRVRKCKPKNSRYIPVAVKNKIYTGECANCGAHHNLEYDHIKKFSHGGESGHENIQLLCRSCNQRKEVLARQLNIFA